jgi:hypothetical protein
MDASAVRFRINSVFPVDFVSFWKVASASSTS